MRDAPMYAGHRPSGRRPLRSLVAALSAVLLSLLSGLFVTATHAEAASLTEVANFGNNPGNLRMYEYVPNNVKPNPAVLVAVHYCTGTAPGFYSGTEFASLANQYGFIVVYPDANVSGQCFDVSSSQALKHEGGSDPTSIASMVRYVEQHNSADTGKIYVTGASSGAMMTDVLLGDYPDLFKAGSVFMGVPFGCFATTDGSGWNSACANGQISKTAQQWGDIARAAYPGYSGPRPRVQLWHGTADTTLYYANFGEEIKQWTNVLGVSQTPVFTDHPQSSWTRTRYGSAAAQPPVEAISVQGVGHALPTSGMAAQAIAFLGLDGSTGGGGDGGTNPPPTGGPCKVAYTTTTWNTGLVASVTITNTGSTPVNGWSLAFTLPSGQTITSGWNATYSPASGNVTAKNTQSNGTIAAGASTNIGFQANHTGNTASPTSFTLNGAACTT